MSSLFLKKFTLFFLLISASLLSTSFAGRQWRYMNKFVIEAVEKTEESSKKGFHHEKQTGVRERNLRVHTRDYESYDPTPALVKPPFKLIPN